MHIGLYIEEEEEEEEEEKTNISIQLKAVDINFVSHFN
jgi:hypothetical protein